MPSPPTYSSANVRSLQTRLACAVAHLAAAVRTITRDKLAMFVILGGLAAFAGSLIGYNLRKVPVFGISLWDAVIGICLSAALTLAQNHNLKRLERGMGDLWQFGRRGAIAGAAGGAAMVAVQVLVGRGPLAMTVAWALESCLMGIFIAPAVPNLPVTKAGMFGAIAGVLGVAAMAIVGASGLPDAVIVAVGDTVKGVLLGAALAMTERMAKCASITVHWNPRESSRLLLGNAPIVFGSSREAHVFIRARTPVPPVAATIQLREGKVILDDRITPRTTTLKSGQRIALGNVQVVVDSGAGDRDGPAHMPTDLRMER